METIKCSDWAAFEQRLREVQQGVPAGETAEFLFRGLSDSTWPLATTLERAGRQAMHVGEYYKLIFPLKPQIESLTGLTWEMATPPEMEKSLQDFDTWNLRRFPDPAAYGYMVHLRHHGFPSPLLDWTRSPYVAAFSGFRSALPPREGNVSIYAYLELPEGYKVTGNTEPWIRRIGPYVRTHRRHFLQQSDYTMCALFEGNGQQYAWRFANHEDLFGAGNTRQDALWKFNIPWTERLKVLRLLDGYNLNAFSLFESQESLMETLALRKLEFPEQH